MTVSLVCGFDIDIKLEKPIRGKTKTAVHHRNIEKVVYISLWRWHWEANVFFSFFYTTSRVMHSFSRFPIKDNSWTRIAVRIIMGSRRGMQITRFKILSYLLVSFRIYNSLFSILLSSIFLWIYTSGHSVSGRPHHSLRINIFFFLHCETNPSHKLRRRRHVKLLTKN